jgi:hypothetical protein
LRCVVSICIGCVGFVLVLTCGGILYITIIYYIIIHYYIILYYTYIISYTILSSSILLFSSQYSSLLFPSQYSFYTCRYLHILIYISSQPISLPSSLLFSSFPTIPFFSSSIPLIHSISRLRECIYQH